jgi:uncharacterized membrane protein YccF (DUF307 family)
MKLIGNLIWLVIYGLWFAAVHFVLGIALCATIVFIPFGLQHIKIARYAIWPFGRLMETDFDKHPIMNLIWIVFGGFLLPVIHIAVGVVLCITLIGIPFAKKCFKLAALSFLPFGAMIA